MKSILFLIAGAALNFAAAANLDVCTAVHGPGASENDFDLVVSGLTADVCDDCQTSITTRASQRGVTIESYTCSPTSTSATFDILLNGGTAGSESFFTQRNIILAALLSCASASTGTTCTCTGC